jgi:hypothetical protein
MAVALQAQDGADVLQLLAELQAVPPHRLGAGGGYEVHL